MGWRSSCLRKWGAYAITARMAATAPFSEGPRFLLIFPLRFLRVAVLLSVWRVILSGRGAVSGMTLQQVLTYTLISEVFANQFACRTEVDSAFWDGSITRCYLRPIGVYAQFASEMVGRWIPGLLLFSLPLVLLAPILGVSGLPASALAGGLFVMSLVLAAWVGTALDYLICALAIAMEWHPWAIGNVRAAMGSLLSGALLPLPLLPFGIGRVFEWLPFAAMASAPLQIYTGTGHPVPLLAMQAAWGMVLWPLAARAWTSTRERMLSYGG